MRLRSIGAVATCVLASFLMLAASAAAGTINVLWYTGGVGTDHGGVASYNADVAALAALAPTAPGGNTWNVTLWNGGAEPAGSYNVLVVASPEGLWAPSPDYTALSSAALSFNPSSQRLLLSGQDADWHYMNAPGGAPDSSNPTAGFNGPEGFLLDSINWAGSGSGLGLVALGMNGSTTCYDSEPNFVLTGYTGDCTSTDNVQIPPSEASFPINTNLTSAGLSNWGTSAHVDFYNLDATLWNGINVNGDDSCAGAPGTCYVTIVSAASAGGGITAAEPASLPLLAIVLAGFAGMELLRRRKAVRA